MPRSNELRPAAIVALTGFMAAGKSTVGRALAALLKWRFVDLDGEIERRSQRTIREIFTQAGEAAFRERENEVLRAVLQEARGATVIALGGGTFVQPQNAALLRDARVRVVFLELPLEDLLQRCRAMGERCDPNPRPLAEDEEAFHALYERRLPHYRKAELVISGEAKSPEQLAREIASVFELMTRGASDR